MADFDDPKYADSKYWYYKDRTWTKRPVRDPFVLFFGLPLVRILLPRSVI